MEASSHPSSNGTSSRRGSHVQSASPTAHHYRGPPRLPLELVLHVLDKIVPSNPSILLPASHSATKTLLAFTSVCRGTYRPASRLLRTRCMYLDSGNRLNDLMSCLPRLVPSLPAPLLLKSITDLHLAPFGPSLYELATAIQVRELFFAVGDSLTRLVVDMPFDSLDLRDDMLNIKRTLRAGFLELAKLEEFTAVGDYPSLSLPDDTTDVWLTWSSLRRLALFHVPLNSHWLWWDVATLEHLEDVVLACPRNLEAANIKDQYYRTRPPGDPSLSRNLRVMLMDKAYEMGTLKTLGWRDRDPEGRMTVEVYEVPQPFYGDEPPRGLVAEWVKRGALDGTLWTWHGEKVEETA